jgi:hypothetical protein
MDNRKAQSMVWMLLALVSFVIAVLAFSGTILADDTVGKVIYGVLWSAIGLAWLGRYFISRKRQSP